MMKRDIVQILNETNDNSFFGFEINCKDHIVIRGDTEKGATITINDEYDLFLNEHLLVYIGDIFLTIYQFDKIPPMIDYEHSSLNVMADEIFRIRTKKITQIEFVS